MRLVMPVLVAAFMSLLAAPVVAEEAEPARPDFNGLWVISERSQGRDSDENFVEMKPEDYLTPKALKDTAEVHPAYDPSSMCLPSMPRHLGWPYPIEIVQTKTRLVNLFEADTVFRIVYLDGRKHPDPDVDTRFMGHAVGHWEGDTLVVDSANFNGKSWVSPSGLRQSEQAHMTEWYSLVDQGKTLQVIVKYEDPENLTRPAWRKYLYNRRDDWEINEYLCQEGNRDNVFAPREGQPGSIDRDDVIVKDHDKD